MRNSTKILGIALVIALLLGVMALPAAGQASRTRLGWLIVDKLTVGSDGATVAGTLAVTGASTMSSTLAVTGDVVTEADVSVGDKLNMVAQTGIVVTNGAAFAPTGTYQPISAAGEVTPTVTVGEEGDIVVLINTSAQTINIADTGTTKLTAAAALGQYDTLTLISDGTNWIELSRTDN